MASRSGLGLLFITHDLGIVASIADRVVVMYSGQVVEESPVRDLFTRPDHPYTEHLLQCSLVSPDAEPSRPPTRASGESTASSGCGCRYLGRCRRAADLELTATCESAEPALVDFGNQHRARCWGVGKAKVTR